MFALVISLSLSLVAKSFMDGVITKRHAFIATVSVFTIISVAVLTYGYNTESNIMVEYGYIDNPAAYASEIPQSDKTPTIKYIDSAEGQSYYVIIEKAHPWWVRFEGVSDILSSSSSNYLAVTETYVYLPK